MTVMCEHPRDDEEVVEVRQLPVYPSEAEQEKIVIEELEKIKAGKIEPKKKIGEGLPSFLREGLEEAEIRSQKKAEERVEAKKEKPTVVEEKPADTEVTLKKEEVEDAIYTAEVKKEEKAERDLPEGCTVEAGSELLTGRDKIRERMEELRLEGLESVVKRTAKEAEKARDNRVELQVQKYEASNAEKPIRRTFEQKQGLSDGVYVEEEKLEAAVEKEVEKPADKKEEIVNDARVGITVFGNYRIIKRMGDGGCGILYEAVADVTGRKVVLKTAKDKEGVQESIEEKNKRLVDEAIINKLLDHEHIVPIQAIMHDADGLAYLQMPFIKGAKKLDVAEKRSLKNIAELVAVAADACSYAHGNGVIHRDIKPANILVDEKGKVYLIDFGVAKLDEKAKKKLENTLTGTGYLDDKLIAGTGKYMPPEVLFGACTADASSDVYSFGKVLYQMLMGSENAEPIGDVKADLIEQTAKLVDARIDNYSAREKLALIVAKATARKEKRYQTMRELAKDLEGIVNDLPGKIVDAIIPSDNVQKNNSGGFFISEDADYYHLHNVSLDGKLHDFSWAKKLLNDGKPATQDEHVKFTKDKKEKLASLPVYNASIAVVVKHRESSTGNQKRLADEVCQMFNADFKEYYMLTSTRASKKRVIHDYGYDNAETINENITYGKIDSNCGLERTAQVLFKTGNCAEIKQTYDALMGRKAHIFTSSIESPVVLGRNVVNRFGIDCDDSIYSNRPARGVVVAQKNLEDRVIYKSESKKCVISAKVIRGNKNLTSEEFIMKASEFATYFNNIMDCYGLRTRIEPISKIELVHYTDTAQELLITNSLSDICNKFGNWRHVTYEEVDKYGVEDRRVSNMFKILFSVPNTKINGEIRYGHVRFDDRAGWGFEANIDCTEAKSPEMVGLIKYLASNFTKMQWFSPKKELEKKGLTLEYAIDLFDNNNFRTPDIKLDKGKPLYSVEGKFLGYANRYGTSPQVNIEFRHGKIFSGAITKFPIKDLIDIGDRYLLKP